MARDLIVGGSEDHYSVSGTPATLAACGATWEKDSRVTAMGSVTALRPSRPKVLEFFAGIGLARLGLERAGFEVAWSNDCEPDKMDLYQGHFRDAEHGRKHVFDLRDIGAVAKGSVDALPTASLAWASSPCTDLSLAGGRAGLDGAKSGTFRRFIEVLEKLEERRPPVAVLENVVGLATSHGGEDLAAAVLAFNHLGYSVDVLSIDARRFLPQSRPRLFLVAAQEAPAGTEPRSELRPDWLQGVYGDPRLTTHRAALPDDPPEPRTAGLGEMVEQLSVDDDRWWNPARTQAFFSSLSPMQSDRVEELRLSPGVKYRTAYRRTRNGVPMWEVRPDDISGCLRTARGGSSKQAVLMLGDDEPARVRWMTPVEYARLMGAAEFEDSLDGVRTNKALFGFGDAVAVDVVAWLAEQYLMPLVQGSLGYRADAAKKVRG